jgi:hypothetical protein
MCCRPQSVSYRRRVWHRLNRIVWIAEDSGRYPGARLYRGYVVHLTEQVRS